MLNCFFKSNFTALQIKAFKLSIQQMIKILQSVFICFEVSDVLSTAKISYDLLKDNINEIIKRDSLSLNSLFIK